MVMERIAFRGLVRAAAVTLLNDYAASQPKSLNVLSARPRGVPVVPLAFVDTITEVIDSFNRYTNQRRPTATIVVLHGLWDSIGAADQADAFADGFLGWVTDNVHAAHANTEVRVVRIDDDPTYTADWLEEPRTYYATRIELEGFANT